MLKPVTSTIHPLPQRCRVKATGTQAWQLCERLSSVHKDKALSELVAALAAKAQCLPATALQKVFTLIFTGPCSVRKRLLPGSPSNIDRLLCLCWALSSSSSSGRGEAAVLAFGQVLYQSQAWKSIFSDIPQGIWDKLCLLAFP